MGVRRSDFRRISQQYCRGPRWKAVRLAALRRDGFACVTCGARGRLEVDHIQPVRDAPRRAYDLGNVQTLCPACHAKKTRIEIGLGRPDPAREAWKKLLLDMQRNPSSTEVKHA